MATKLWCALSAVITFLFSISLYYGLAESTGNDFLARHDNEPLTVAMLRVVAWFIAAASFLYTTVLAFLFMLAPPPPPDQSPTKKRGFRTSECFYFLVFSMIFYLSNCALLGVFKNNLLLQSSFCLFAMNIISFSVVVNPTRSGAKLIKLVGLSFWFPALRVLGYLSFYSSLIIVSVAAFALVTRQFHPSRLAKANNPVTSVPLLNKG